MSRRERSMAPANADASITAMWRELEGVNWRKPPYYGMIAATARQLGMAPHAGNSAMRNRRLRFGMALLKNKRALEKRIYEAYYGSELDGSQAE